MSALSTRTHCHLYLLETQVCAPPRPRYTSRRGYLQVRLVSRFGIVDCGHVLVMARTSNGWWLRCCLVECLCGLRRTIAQSRICGGCMHGPDWHGCRRASNSGGFSMHDWKCCGGRLV